MEKENRSRFSDFFRTEYASLKRYVRSILSDRSDVDAEDIIQEVALNIFSRVDFETPVENLGAYIYRSLRNRVIDLQRNRKRKMQKQIEDTQVPEVMSSYFDIIEEHPDPEFREYIIERLFHAMESMNPDYQNIIWATEFEGMTFQDLSDEMNIPIGTLLSRKHRAIGSLQRIFKEENPDLLEEYFDNNY